MKFTSKICIILILISSLIQNQFNEYSKFNLSNNDQIFTPLDILPEKEEN